MVWHRKLLANTYNMWSGIVVFTHSTVDVLHVQNEMILQYIMLISDAHQCLCHMHKSRPTNIMDSCSHYDTAAIKSVDLLQPLLSLMFPVICCNPSACKRRKMKLIWEQSSTWHMSISPSAGTTTDTLLRRYVTLVF